MLMMSKALILVNFILHLTLPYQHINIFLVFFVFFSDCIMAAMSRDIAFMSAYLVEGGFFLNLL